MKALRIPITFSLFFTLLFSSLVHAETVTSYEQIAPTLMGKSTKNKQLAINWLTEQPEKSQNQRLLNGWLNGDLYFHPETNQLYVIDNLAVNQQAETVYSQSTLVITNTRDFKKVRVNNKLRKEIRSELAKMGLFAEDSTTRLNAVLSLVGNTEPALNADIALALATEKDSAVINAMTLATAAFGALSDNKSIQLASIVTLSSYKNSIVFSRLTDVMNKSTDAEVLAAAQKGLDQYQQSQRLYSGVETAFFGLSMGSILVLAAIGLAITFGVMGVINMAHGELIMIGAYTTYVMQLLMPNHLGLSLILSVPMAFLVSGAVGIAIERGVIRHLYGRPLETLLATFGLSLILQQAVRSIFSPLNRSVSTPDFMSGALQINPMLSITYNRLYIVLFCFAVFMALLTLLKRTPLGLQVRAVSQNRSMAKAMGIRSERVDALTFGLGSGVAGVAGVALSQLTNVGPNMGQAYIIDSFMVVVFGGVGNLWGTLVAGLGLGIFNKILEPWAGAVLAKILVLVFIILFIQKRPRGLFPQRGRAAES
ncbi:urea ABC transporter permease subunit UrtB [Vibrio sp. 10N.261.51.F12]|uniref:urea ABC transporter permease subunit UrtB n=1 Tax=Vibrio sp. 10N.261.51.F12 TaxID=3229679 RepID=UPI00354E4D4C